MATIATIITKAGTVPAFDVREPVEQTVPLVFCSPHSGHDYPAAFLDQTKLTGDAIRRSEDLFVDDLFACAVDVGAPLLAARFPRAFLDVNREPYELDPRMFEGMLPAYANTTSIRVAAGLGTIPRIVAENEEIYVGKIAIEEGLERIETYYRSFHARLGELLMRTRDKFGLAILVDCHSMPSNVRLTQSGRRASVVVGDRFGTSAAGHIVQLACDRFSGQGFDVARNKPYAGGYITERYGRPPNAFHALQIEINRSLYADEARFRRNGAYEETAGRLRAFVTSFAFDIASDYDQPLAAE